MADPRSITAENPLDLPLEIGQVVEVKTPPGNLVFKQAMAVLLITALSFTAGFFLARWLFPNAGEGAFAGMGAIFLIVVPIIIYQIKKRMPRNCGKTSDSHSGQHHTITKIIEYQ